MLRGQLARWSADNLENLRRAKPRMPDGFYNRVACNWRALLAVGDLAGGGWPRAARASAKALTSKEPGTVYAETLAAIRKMFEEQNTNRMFSEDIAKELHGVEGGAWAEWGKNAKPISQNSLARLLKPIAPETMRIGDQQKKGYHLHQFVDVFARYLDPDIPTCPPTPPLQPSNRPNRDGMGASDALATVPPEFDGADGKCEKSKKGGLWDGGTVVRGGGHDDEGSGGDESGLSRREIQKLAGWYTACADELRDGGAVLDQDKLDSRLRDALRKRVLPEAIDTEVARVIEAAFRRA
jgi:hypothetical protein